MYLPADTGIKWCTVLPVYEIETYSCINSTLYAASAVALPFSQNDTSFSLFKRNFKGSLIQQCVPTSVTHVVRKLTGVSLVPGWKEPPPHGLQGPLGSVVGTGAAGMLGGYQNRTENNNIPYRRSP